MARDTTVTYPPTYVIRASLEASPPSRLEPCEPVPTEHGPRLTLGQLGFGVYAVTIGPGDTIGRFSVRHPGPGFTIGGTVRSGREIIAARVDIARDTSEAGQDYEPLDSAVSDPAFEFRHLTPARYRLIASAAGYIADTVYCSPNADTAVDMFLGTPPRPQPITGTVYNIAGTPLPGCTLSLAVELGDSTAVFSAVTGSTGTFKMSGMGPELFNTRGVLTAHLDGYEPFRESVPLGPVGVPGRAICMVAPSVDFPHSARAVSGGAIISLRARLEPSSDSAHVMLRLRYSLQRTALDDTVYDIHATCMWSMCNDPLSGRALLHEASALTPGGQTVALEPAQPLVSCDSSARQLMLAGGDSVVGYGPLQALLSATDSIVVTAWLLGNDATTSVTLGIAIPRLPVHPRPGARAVRRACPFGPGGTWLRMRAECCTMVEVFDITGRLIQRPSGLSGSVSLPGGTSAMRILRITSAAESPTILRAPLLRP